MPTPFQLLAILLSLTALLGFVNHRVLRLPGSIGLFALAVAAALAIGLLNRTLLPGAGDWLRGVLRQVDLPQTLLQGLLSFLLFAGAVRTDAGGLWQRRWQVLALATVGTALALAVVGTGVWVLLRLAGAPLPLVWCLVLGAAIAPTDLVAVLAILARQHLPRPLLLAATGESLFNDGVAIVAFTTLLGIAAGTRPLPGAADLAVELARTIGGALLLGLGAGWIGYLAKRATADPPTELMMSLAVATGTFALASALQVSPPIAVVLAGLVIGRQADRHLSSDQARHLLSAFWEMVEAVLNALLFLVVGLEAAAVVQWRLAELLAGAAAVLLALAARFASIWPVLPRGLAAGRRWRASLVLTWAGLRGGITVALALSLPDGEPRARILVICYVVVAFSILAQGLSLARLAERLLPTGAGRSGGG
jgi:CPA1 family monovalent cation:H+ antiporter